MPNYLYPIVLLIVGALLMLYANCNPKWQSADSYDALMAFIFGAICLLLGFFGVVGVWILRCWVMGFAL